MNAKAMIAAAAAGKTAFRSSGNQIANLAFTRHTNGTYVYMDVVNGVFVTVDRVEAVADHEILGWADDAPVLTIKTEEWFA